MGENLGKGERKGRKEGGGLVAYSRKRKAPQGEPYGARRGRLGS